MSREIGVSCSPVNGVHERPSSKLPSLRSTPEVTFAIFFCFLFVTTECRTPFTTTFEDLDQLDDDGL